MTKSAEYQYFGSIMYIKNIADALEVQFEVFENYKKSTLRNKLVLPCANGLLELSIPIKGGRDIKAIIKDIEIDNTFNWQEKHFKTLVATYNNSAWFQFYEPKLKLLYQQKPVLLIQWNKLCLNFVFEALKINVNMTETENYIPLFQHNNIIDCRSVFEKTSNFSNSAFPKYFQVFEEKIGFQPNMCILDLIFAEGNNAKNLLFN
jgi:hypothetical protein